ncbi:haloacid dehalogenase-like hydrolase family protein [Burkholderia pseudomallei MSHR7504]|nr:haloacid dehalogenase-like hydrolase family protein [Burkholderia pseudomallei MSHR7504]
MTVKAVVFDFGGVLIDWSPEYLYRKLIPDEAERRWFLTHVCGMDWVVRQDGGQTIEEGTAERIALFPEHEALIRAFYARWHEMIGGELADGAALVDALDARGVPLLLVRADVSVCVGELPRAAAFQGHRRVRPREAREARSGDLPRDARADRTASAGHRAARARFHRRQREERGGRGRARLARDSSHERRGDAGAAARAGRAWLTARVMRGDARRCGGAARRRREPVRGDLRRAVRRRWRA